jgi:hypothetical protein
MALPTVIVALGGSAMAAHHMRRLSADADFYIADLDDDAVAAVAARNRAELGEDFKLDITPSNSTWGKIALKDIEQSPVVAEIDTRNGRVELRALSPEDLFLLKISAGRTKDIDDLPAIAKATTLERVVARANAINGWYGDRAGLPDYVVRMIEHTARIFGASEPAVEAALQLPDVVRRRLEPVRAAQRRREGLLAEARARRPGPGGT